MSGGVWHRFKSSLLTRLSCSLRCDWTILTTCNPEDIQTLPANITSDTGSPGCSHFLLPFNCVFSFSPVASNASSLLSPPLQTQAAKAADFVATTDKKKPKGVVVVGHFGENKKNNRLRPDSSPECRDCWFRSQILCRDVKCHCVCVCVWGRAAALSAWHFLLSQATPTPVAI